MTVELRILQARAARIGPKTAQNMRIAHLPVVEDGKKKDTSRTLRRVTGVLFWSAVLAGAAIFFRAESALHTTFDRVREHVLRAPRIYAVEFPAAADVDQGSVVRIERDGELYSAGYVAEMRVDEGVKKARIAIFPQFADRVNGATRFVSHRTDGGVAWVLQTLLPEDRMAEIRDVARSRWYREKDRFMDEIQPGVVRLGEDVIEVLREDFPRVLKERDAEFRELAVVMRERGWEDNFEGVFNEVLWPRFREKSLPTLKGVGDEIVAEFPVWAVSWAYLVENLPFGGEDKVERKVREFLVEKATPIVSAKGPELRKAANEVFREAAADERTLKAIDQAVRDIGGDPRFRKAMKGVLDTWLIANPRVREVIGSAWSRPDLRGPAERFLSRLEPDVHRIANGIVLNAERDGINPGLARVLRRKLLRENESWVLLELDDSATTATPDRFSGIDGGVR